MLEGEVCDLLRASEVVSDRLRRAGLHQGHVLVGRGVKDDLGLLAREDLVHPRRVHDVGDARNEARLRRAGEVQQEVEERVLGLLDEDQVARRGSRDLSHELAPDGASSAGDEDALAPHQAADRGVAQADRVSPEQVLNGHISNPGDRDLTSHDLGESRDGLGGNTDRSGQAMHDADPLAWEGGGREEDLLGSEEPNLVDQVFQAAHHRQAQHDLAPLGRVVVEKGDRSASQLRPREELPGQEGAAGASSDEEDRDLGRRSAGPSGLRQDPTQDPDAEDARDREHEVDQDHAVGHDDVAGVGHSARQGLLEGAQQSQSETDRADPGQDSLEVEEADVAPREAGDAEQPEREILRADDVGPTEGGVLDELKGELAVEARQVGEPVGGAQGAEVDQDPEGPEDVQARAGGMDVAHAEPSCSASGSPITSPA